MVGTRVMTMMIRTYTQLQKIPEFLDRFEYLRLAGVVGQETFGFDRHLNQQLYTSPRWRAVRDEVIIRDGACDLGVPGYDLGSRIYVHHMNPISANDILQNHDFVWDPEFLICTSFNTHNAIHYGNQESLPKLPIQRTQGDTTPWK